MTGKVMAAWVPYGRTLRELRRQSGMSCRALAREVACAESLISKAERANRRISVQVNKQLGAALARHIPHAEQRLDVAHTRAVRSSQHTWYTDIADLEAEATAITIWEPLLIPGVFQIEAYAEAVFSDGRPKDTPEQISQLVRARMERFHMVSTKEVWAIVDETALYRAVGGHQTMATQIRHLMALVSKHRRVTIVPRTAPYCGGLAGSIILLSTHDRTTAYVEHTAGGDIISDPDEAARISAVWREISAWALSPPESIKAMEAAVKFHESQV